MKTRETQEQLIEQIQQANSIEELEEVVQEQYDLFEAFITQARKLHYLQHFNNSCKMCGMPMIKHKGKMFCS